LSYAPLVTARDEVRLVSTMVVVDTIDALLMGIFERKVWSRRSKGPNLDSVIETGRGEDLRVFRVLRKAKTGSLVSDPAARRIQPQEQR
jgi:hypothetical protein